MLHRVLTALALEKAEYLLHLKRRCRFPGGAWVRDAGTYLHYELLGCYQDMLEARPKAMNRYATIASFAPDLPSDVMDAETRREIEIMLKRARKVGAEYYRKFDRDPQLLDFMRKAAASIAKDLNKMKAAN